MKTLLVDDHTLFREGLAMLISHGFPQVELLQAGDLAEALAAIASAGDVGLVLLDLALPDSMGVQPGSITVTARGLVIGFVNKQQP